MITLTTTGWKSRGIGRGLAVAAVTLCTIAVLSAAHLDVMSAGAMEPAVALLAVEYQRISGHTTTVAYGTAPELTVRLTRGDRADVLIAPSAVVDQATRDGRVVAASRVSVGRIGVGIFVRSGSPVPNVSSEEALRRALLSAERVVYTQGSSGQHIDSVLATLGVAASIGSKLARVADAETALARVAGGSAGDLGFGAITAIKAFEGKGTVFVAPLPDSLQNFTTYDAAVMAGGREPRASTAFLRFLGSPAARSVLNAVGVQSPLAPSPR